MKDSNEVITEFNEIVNMTASDLEEWLKSDDSRSAGWPKEDENGETVGHDSGRKIVEILEANPGKDPEKYTEEQIQHMRKVVSYCKRHLAQEEKTNNEKSVEEVKKTKSYASLKNWGHDFLKARGEADDDAGDEDDAEAEKEEDIEEEVEEEDAEEESDEDEDDEGEKETGDKRKKAPTAQSGANKKRETAKGEASKDEKNGNEVHNGKDGSNGNSKKDDDDDDDEEESGKPAKGPKPGDTVSWKWGNGNPEGKVLDVKDEKTTIKTKRGNEVTRDGDAEDPAVVLDTGKSKAIKSNHELNES